MVQSDGPPPLSNKLVCVTDSSAPRITVRPEIRALAAYRQGKPAPADAFKLSSNENPFDPIPAVVQAIEQSAHNRYPDGASAELRARLAAKYGVAFEEVHVGAGSVSILAQLIQATSGPGDEVIFAWRSFEAYPGLVTVSGATSVMVPNSPDHRHDLPAMAAAVTEHTRVIVVCSPNNPTGTIVSAEEFAAFMTSVPPTVLIILDEAYIEFVTDPLSVNGAQLWGRYPNLVVVRTFSKAYGLAGLRVGYALGSTYILDAARSSAIPLSVTEAAQRAAIAAQEHESELLERVARIISLRDEVWIALTAQGWEVPQPHGNFVWLPTGDNTQQANEVLLTHGIVGRPFASDGIRVSIGEPESVSRLLKASEEVVRMLPRSRGPGRLD